MDFERFPILKLAYQVGQMGGLMPTVMNAANEAAVKLFLNDQISFLDIESIIIETVHTFKNIDNPSLDEIIETDIKVQKMLRNHYERGTSC